MGIDTGSRAGGGVEMHGQLPDRQQKVQFCLLEARRWRFILVVLAYNSHRAQQVPPDVVRPEQESMRCAMISCAQSRRRTVVE